MKKHIAKTDRIFHEANIELVGADMSRFRVFHFSFISVYTKVPYIITARFPHTIIEGRNSGVTGYLQYGDMTPQSCQD
jgi:hypothetical protein